MEERGREEDGERRVDRKDEMGDERKMKRPEATRLKIDFFHKSGIPVQLRHVISSVARSRRPAKRHLNRTEAVLTLALHR
jgi:hypothetical protein